MNQAFEAERDPNLVEVWEWFEFQNSLLADERLRILRVLSGQVTPDQLMLGPGIKARFRGLTKDEADEYFEQQRTRLELNTMLDLLVTTEAILRTHFYKRVARRLKDDRSKKFRQIARTRPTRIRLKEDILGVLAEELKPQVSDFRGALKLRDWLAHGRGWTPKLGRTYAPGDIFDICKALVDAL